MTEPTTPSAEPRLRVIDAGGHAVVRRRRSWIAQAAWQTLGKWGARIGGAWVLAVAFLAVFGPVLASSHPLLWRDAADPDAGWGGWWSPLLVNLTAIDVWLLAAAALGGVMAMCGWMSAGSRWGAWCLGTLILVPLCGWASAWRWLNSGTGDTPAGLWMLLAVLAAIGLAIYMGALVQAWQASRPQGERYAYARWVVLLVVAAWAVPLIAEPPLPPQTVVYSQYREAIADRPDDIAAVFTLLPYSPNDRFRDLPDQRLLPPSLAHPMGTTAFGEDLATRMVHASRIALAIGLVATGIAVFIGVVVGAAMGYFVGKVDLLGMRAIEVFDAIPVIFLLIMIVAFYGRSLMLMMTILGLTGWVGYALFVRAEFLRLRNADYVLAARAAGVPTRAILFRHLLPNGVTPVLVLASFGIAGAITTESVLSFLGLGLVNEPSWGQMLAQAQSIGGGFKWWLAIYPGGAIFLTVLAYNLIGEALRDALDPKTA
ncbi:MAG: ABC transporter permease [Planctomycetota bacterium]